MTKEDIVALKEAKITALDQPISMNRATEKLNELMIEWEEHPEHFEGVNPFAVACHDAVRNTMMIWNNIPKPMSLDELHLTEEHKHDEEGDAVVCWIEYPEKPAVNVTAPYVPFYAWDEPPWEREAYVPYIGTEYSDTVRLDDYGKTWRCWTSMPTEEQRRAVAW